MTNYTGVKFNRLTFIKKIKGIKWECLCDCGNVCEKTFSEVKCGVVKSCGCYRKDKLKSIKTTHGMAKTKLYSTWNTMIQRCKDISNPYYGGKGISVCKRWNKFENFYKDMGDKPSAAHSIERLNSNKSYSPENCVWASATTQANNTAKNVRVHYDGEFFTVSELARHLGINYGTLYKRINTGRSGAELSKQPRKDKRYS